MINNFKDKLKEKGEYKLAPILVEIIKQLSPEDLEDLKKNKHFENVMDLIELRYKQNLVIKEARDLLS